jgi:hypothetical protein
MALEVLYLALMLLGRLSGFESAEIAPFPGFGSVLRE